MNSNLEFEYKRNGTQTLIPSFEPGTGEIISHRIAASFIIEFSYLTPHPIFIENFNLPAFDSPASEMGREHFSQDKSIIIEYPEQETSPEKDRISFLT